MWGNCLWWALRQWWTHGGYIVVKKADHLPLPHVMWVQELGNREVQAFVPLKSSRRWWKGLWYKGHVKTSRKR